MYFKTAYELLKAGKRIKRFGENFEYLWCSPQNNAIMMRIKNGSDVELPYSQLNKYTEENSNEWELDS